MDALGYHYLIELYDCKASLLTNVEFLEKLMRSAVKESGANEIGHLFHKFSPHGASGVVLISESHFSIHTWPEHKYAAIDLFTCSTAVDIDFVYQKIKSELFSTRSFFLEIKRGADFISS